jgi:uncharacterized protein YybS (DUF2232 family)
LDRIKNEDYKSTAVAFLIALALVLALFWLSARDAGMVVLAALALPPLLGYAMAGGGFAAGSLAAALCLAVGFVLDSRLAALLAALCLPFAFALGYVLRKKVRFRHSVMAAAAAAAAGVLLAVGALWLMTGRLPVDWFFGWLSGSFSSMSDAAVHSLYQLMRAADLMTGAVTQAALDATARADAIAYIVNQLKEWFNYNLVGLIGTYALLLGLLGYLIPRAALRRRQVAVIAIPPFSEFALPNRFWLAFLASFLFAAIGESLGWPGFDILNVTIQTLYALVLTVQGLSFLDYLYKKRKMGAAARVALHALVLVVSSGAALIGSLLVWVGLFENMLQLRKRMETKGGAVL